MCTVTLDETSTECNNDVVFALLLFPVAKFVEAVKKKTRSALLDIIKSLSTPEKDHQNAHFS
jgi:hypothetical protein